MRPILIASALALAVPAMAQNATVDDINPPPPTENLASPDAQDRVAPVMAPGQTPTNSVSSDSTATRSSTVGHGTSGSAASSTSTPEGTMDTMSSTGTTTGVSRTGVAGFTGTGGPDEPTRSYPVCSRSITDSCLQVRSSPRPRR
jgi:hypothetical protein